MAATIENKICEAVEAICGKVISKAGFDKTIQATIVACTDEANGQYKVKYQDNTFYAYSGDIEKKYSKNNRVYVLIPGNDMSRDKTILGIVGKSSQYTATEAGDVYEKTSINLVATQAGQYGIYSGTKYNINENYTTSEPLDRYGKRIYAPNNDGYTIRLLDNSIINKYMKKSDSIQIEASFRTNFPENIINGKYGLKVVLLCGDGTDNRLETLSLDFEHGIDGQFYSFYSFQSRNFVFQKPEDFIQIERIEVFAKDFDEQDGGEGGTAESLVESESYDIFIKDIGIYTVNAVRENIQTGIRLIMPNGIVLLNIHEKLIVQAQVLDQGNIMNDNANIFYWFKRDLSVDNVQSEGYCKFGGHGWYCLNDKDTAGNWKQGINTFAFSNDEHLLSKENLFKVVSYRVSGETIIQYEREFTLFNQERDNSIVITHNKQNNIVLRNAEDFSVSCDYTPVQGEENYDYKFYWNLELRDRKLTTNNEVKNFLNAIFTNKEVRDFGSSDITSIHYNSVISNITLSGITTSSYITFICTAKKEVEENGIKKEYTMGTAELTVLLEDAIYNNYTLEIENANQIFQYDEYGNPPTKDGNYTPPPLKIKMLDNKTGNLINIDEEIVSNNLTIEWRIPENTTYLVTSTNPSDGYVLEEKNGYCKSLSYTLKGPFVNPDTINNNITVVVNYNEMTYEKTTNFLFIAQGDEGTNGTLYTARIVPNSLVDSPRWAVFYTTGGDGGYFNFGPDGTNSKYYVNGTCCQIDNSGNPVFPFKVELYANNELVFKGNVTNENDNENQGNENDNENQGNENENQNNEDYMAPDIQVEWSMNTLSYESQRTTVDKSNFTVLKDYSPNNETNKYLTMNYYKKLYRDNTTKITNSDKERTPANILQCKVTYIPKIKEIIDKEDSEDPASTTEVTQTNKAVTLYATLPIVTVVNKSSNDYLLEFDETSGFNEVTYDKEGTTPRFDNTHNKFTVKCNNRSISSGKWYIKGYAGIEVASSTSYKYIAANNLVKKGKKITDIDKQNSQIIDPVYICNGISYTNAILFKYNNSFVHIPIDMHLNRYALAMLNGWDGNTIEINNDGGYILTPQLGAGKKEDDNSFTGILMGDVKQDANKKMQTGLYGFHAGERTFGLFADTGTVAIGKSGKSQIVLDPSANSGFIYSDDFFVKETTYKSNGTTILKESAYDNETGLVKTEVLNDLWTNGGNLKDSAAKRINENGKGMLIDFSGHIYFANGTFHLSPNGRLTCEKGHFSDGTGKNEHYYVDLKDNTATSSYFLYCRPKTKNEDNDPTFYVKKSGELFSTSGQLGGFYIKTDKLSSSNKYYNSRENNKDIITLSTTGFSRQGMNVLTAYNSNNVAFDRYDAESILSNANDDDLLDNSVVIKITKVKLKANTTIPDVIFATGDDFAVTNDGKLYSKSHNCEEGLFKTLSSETIIVADNLYVGKNLYIKGNLAISGSIYLVGANSNIIRNVYSDNLTTTVRPQWV